MCDVEKTLPRISSSDRIDVQGPPTGKVGGKTFQKGDVPSDPQATTYPLVQTTQDPSETNGGIRVVKQNGNPRLESNRDSAQLATSVNNKEAGMERAAMEEAHPSTVSTLNGSTGPTESLERLVSGQSSVQTFPAPQPAVSTDSASSQGSQKSFREQVTGVLWKLAAPFITVYKWIAEKIFKKNDDSQNLGVRSQNNGVKENDGCVVVEVSSGTVSKSRSVSSSTTPSHGQDSGFAESSVNTDSAKDDSESEEVVNQNKDTEAVGELSEKTASTRSVAFKNASLANAHSSPTIRDQFTQGLRFRPTPRIEIVPKNSMPFSEWEQGLREQKRLKETVNKALELAASDFKVLEAALSRLADDTHAAGIEDTHAASNMIEARQVPLSRPAKATDALKLRDGGVDRTDSTAVGMMFKSLPFVKCNWKAAKAHEVATFLTSLFPEEEALTEAAQHIMKKYSEAPIAGISKRLFEDGFPVAAVISMRIFGRYENTE